MYNGLTEILEELQRATQMASKDQQSGLAALNALFRAGSPPDPLPASRYQGKLFALNLAPGLTWLLDGITSAWMPWKGKVFDPAQQGGDNVFGRDSFTLAHVFWPLYRGYREDGPDTYRAFPFRTYVGAGKVDTDRQVLKLDYDLPKNPSLSIRRVLDELVELSDSFYLGKAHMKWWWGRWQTVAYFSLVGSE